MKIAVPFENNNIYSHFENAISFKIYEIENGKVVTMRFIPVSDISCISIDAILCGNIGENTKNEFQSKSISVHSGFSGNADVALKAFLEA